MHAVKVQGEDTRLMRFFWHVVVLRLPRKAREDFSK